MGIDTSHLWRRVIATKYGKDTERERESKAREREIIMATYDLTLWIALNLDHHLMFPILEFLQEHRLYEDGQILKEKIELLNKTNMVRS